MNATQERTLWDGTPSQWINAKTYINSGIMFVFGLVLGGLLIASESPVGWAIIAMALIVCGGRAGWAFLLAKSMKYSITTERLIVKSGVFSRKTTQLELYRVRDLQVDEPFLLRTVGLGNLLIITADKTDPEITIRAISKAGDLAETIRTRIFSTRDRRQIREVDVS